MSQQTVNLQSNQYRYRCTTCRGRCIAICALARIRYAEFISAISASSLYKSVPSGSDGCEADLREFSAEYGADRSRVLGIPRSEQPIDPRRIENPDTSESARLDANFEFVRPASWKSNRISMDDSVAYSLGQTERVAARP